MNGKSIESIRVVDGPTDRTKRASNAPPSSSLSPPSVLLRKYALRLTIFPFDALNVTARCPAEDWNFLNCSNNCVSYDGDCASCASHFERDGCVYCEGDDLCLFKDNSELCQCPYSECGPTDCSNHTTCDECTGDLLCGWCNTTGKCVAGRGSGPCANGSCPGFPAAWNYASCDNYCACCSGAGWFAWEGGGG